MNGHRSMEGHRPASGGRCAVVAAATACLLLAGEAVAYGAGPAASTPGNAPEPVTRGAPPALREARAGTLWIFDADFEDLTGDNAGWTSYDVSGALGQTNYWHHDTIRLTEPYLGDSTWWCGTYHPCWRQPRGYGNDWIQYLERDFPLAAWSSPGDYVQLEWDQRYAMERLYDYGYVDVSTDGGSSWVTIAMFNNVGFQGPGIGADWDHPWGGHRIEDLSTYAGTDIRLRYRFESDVAYSSQDQYDNTQHSCKDGAWQLDNITLRVNDDVLFYDDAESGNMGWVHEDIPTTGQTGVTFFRGQYGIDFGVDLPFSCDEPPIGSWMYAAVDPLTGTTVDDQDCQLISPPIAIAGAENLVASWNMWVDLPRPANSVFNLYLSAGDVPECLTYTVGFVDEELGWWYGGPIWTTKFDDWSAFGGHDWLGVMWALMNDEPPEPGVEHPTGIFLNRQRVGVVEGDLGTRWRRDAWCSFCDWFEDDLVLALGDTARVRVLDEDGIVTVYLLATDDGGANWEAYACEEHPWEDWWLTPSPVNQIAPGHEILYYWEATDGVGNTSTYPRNAPEEAFEFSILPILGSMEDPVILLVDKHDANTTGEDRRSRNASEIYYREALDVLGYAYDVYDFDYSKQNFEKYADTSDMRYYDTQIWFANRDFEDPEGEYRVLHHREQARLIQWLSQAEGGRDRNLLLSGNEINSELAGAWGETLGFATTWLATEFLADDAGDTLPVLRDAAGGFGFMDYDDRQCVLAGGCPSLSNFDAIRPTGAEGSEPVAEYVTPDRAIWPAGVAYTHPTLGYQTVNLGFGIEFMMDSLLPSGYYATGVADRADLLANVLEYFGKEPDGPGTGISEDRVYAYALSRPAPNPTAPSAAIAYSVAHRGRVAVRVYSVAGRLVKTLVDAELGPGGYRAIWDGTTGSGDRAASGVYFVRMEADGFEASRKLVLLK